MNIKDLSKNDKTYWDLSKQVYNFSENQKSVIVNDGDKKRYMKIRAKRIDKQNGFKAMVVSPIDKHGKVDEDTLYFAYAGTSIVQDHGEDLGADVSIAYRNFKPIQTKYSKATKDKYANLDQTVIQNESRRGKIENLSQFDEAKIWTSAAIKAFKPKKTYGTGHSLGGAKGLLMGALFHFDKVRTFSAPNVFRLLPFELQKEFEENRNKGQFVNYVHNSDIIGNFSFMAPSIGENVVLFYDEPSLNLIKGHSLNSFKFCGNNLIIKMDYDHLTQVANELANKIFILEQCILHYNQYEEKSKKRARKIEQKYIDRVASGEYEYINSRDIENYMSELSKTGKYDFYNSEVFEEIKYRLRERKQLFINISQQIHDVISKLREVEYQVSGYFGLQ